MADKESLMDKLERVSINGNGRISFSVRLRPDVMDAFKKMCDDHGFSVGKRIEIALINDMREQKKSEKSTENRESPPVIHAVS